MAEKIIDDKTVGEGIVSDIQECLDNGKKKNNTGTWKAIFASNDFLDIQYSTVFEEELKKIIASLPGEDEIKSEKLTLKNMKTGEQEQKTIEEIIEYIK